MAELALDQQPVSAATHARQMQAYCGAGQKRAAALHNRGPVRFTSNGQLHPDIVAAYRAHGCYVFENVIAEEELSALRTDINYLLAHAPVGEGAALDAQNRPAYGRQFKRSPYIFIKPLSDPWGGTKLLGGRHPTQMLQPAPAADAPAEVVHLLSGMCQTMPSGLRLYGHPALLGIAAAINGADFVPYNDATFVKQPGLGGSVSWHQDGVTHWEADDWHENIHGFNFQVQLYTCTPANCLWVVPGTHKQGRINIKQRVADNGDSERLPDAVPLLCNPGDVTIANRQLLHGSFANTSADLRVSLTFGFHLRRSVLGAHGALSQGANEVYDEQRIFERASVIPVAVDARSQYYPHEQRFHYQPFAGLEDQFRYNDENFAKVVKDYNLKDLSI